MVYVAGGSELYHHGILGQKWGVRRYQNPDGSYTAAGRKRYGIGSEKGTENIRVSRNSSSPKEPIGQRARNKINSISPETKKKIAIGATVAVAATVAAVYLKNHPEKIADGAKFIAKNASKIKNESLPKAIEKGKKWAKKKAIETGKKAVSSAKKEVKRAALRAGGAIALKKLKEQYDKTLANNPNLNEYEKAALDSVYSGLKGNIESKSNGSSNNSNNSNNSSATYKRMKDKVGPPSMNGKIDKQTKEWQAFINTVPQDKKGAIKSLANDGYSYEQLRKAVNL